MLNIEGHARCLRKARIILEALNHAALWIASLAYKAHSNIKLYFQKHSDLSDTHAPSDLSESGGLIMKVI